MEKTIPITIAETEFRLTSKAFEKLTQYLESLKTHFAHEADTEEILRDIESRIAEKLLDKKNRLITEEEVDKIILDMGHPSEMDSGESEPAENSNSQNNKNNHRKLYRDGDEAIITGVAAGIAHYFDVDPIFIRTLFVISIFIGGTGIFIYILLSIFVPEAKTASQKLEMEGSAVTLENIKQTVKDRVAETKKRGTLTKLFNLPFDIMRKILPFISKVFGSFLAFISFLGALALSVGAAVVLANWEKPYVDMPILHMTSIPLLYLGAIAAYIGILIPFIFLFSLAYKMLKAKNLLSTATSFGLLGLWCLMVITSGVVATRIIGDYYDFTSKSPEYKQVSNTLNLNFESLNIESIDISIENGSTTAVLVEGKQMDIENIVIDVREGTLFVSPPEQDHDCLFCNNRTPSVTIITPSLTSLNAENSSLRFDDYNTDTLTLNAKSSQIRGNLNASNLNITGQNSSFNFNGSASSTTINLLDSSLYAPSFVIGEALVDTDNSSLELYVTDTLDIQKNTSSSIRNRAEESKEDIDTMNGSM